MKPDWKGERGRPAKNSDRRRELLANGEINGVVGAQLPGPMLLQVQRAAAHELVSVSAFVRTALEEKIFRDIDAEKDDDTARDRG